MKVTKIGDSHYIIIPSEFIKVFNLIKAEYDLNVKDDGNTLIYNLKKRSDTNEEK